MDDLDIFLSKEVEDKFDDLLKKYKDELKGYEYIKDLTDFALLPLKGSMRYINKYDKELRFGGLLIKIYERYGNYYALLKKSNGKIYNISYNNNFIFYMKNNDDKFRDDLKCFISDFEKGLYEY